METTGLLASASRSFSEVSRSGFLFLRHKKLLASVSIGSQKLEVRSWGRQSCHS